MNDIPELPTGSETPSPGPATPTEGSLRYKDLPDGRESVQMYSGGEWVPALPPVGQVLRIDTERGWRVEMFNGERWLCLGEFELQEGRVKRIGSFPDRGQIEEAATRHATEASPGASPWGTHYSFDVTGLSNLIDEIMDEHRYPPLPEGDNNHQTGES